MHTAHLQIMNFFFLISIISISIILSFRTVDIRAFFRERVTAGKAGTNIPTKLVKMFNPESWESGFQNAAEVQLTEVPVIQGNILEEFSGTYYRNGPGNFENCVNAEDGDGFLTALTFHKGKAFFRSRFLRTAPYLREQAKKKRLYRGKYQVLEGLFGPGSDLRSKNVGNSNLVYFGKRLLALYNHGLPYKVEPLSLTCLDPVNIGQQVPDNAMFNACPKIDPTTGRLICYSLSSDRKQIQIYEFDSKYISHSTREERVGRLFTDDFAFTKNFYIFFEPAVNFDAASYGFNRKPLAACCNMDSSKPTLVHLVPRNPTVKKQEFQIDATFLISVANAYEDEDGSIILDAVCDSSLPWRSGSKNTPAWKGIDFSTYSPKLFRITFKEGSKKQQEVLYDFPVDSPFIHPSKVGLKHRYLFGTCSRDSVSPPDSGLVQIDLLTRTKQNWFPEANTDYIGECSFIPVGETVNELTGYIIATIRNGLGHSSQVAIFNVDNISTGPICRIDVGFLPKGFSGSFAPLSFSLEEIDRAIKLNDAFGSKSWNEVESSFSGLGFRGDF